MQNKQQFENTPATAYNARQSLTTTRHANGGGNNSEMRDITDAHVTTREQSFQSPDPTDDNVHIVQLLTTLDTIPREELPDDEHRRALAILIRYGFVDNLYRPLGADYHNIAWAHMGPTKDPRQRISAWLEMRHEFWSKPGMTGLPASLKPIARELGYDVGDETTDGEVQA